MRYSTESTLPSDPGPSELRKLLEEQEAALACLKMVQIANREIQKRQL
jgi:hypothetical protein